MGPFDCAIARCLCASLFLVAGSSCEETESPHTGSFFVDLRATPGGNGSKEKPLQTLEEALLLATADATIIVAAGVYVVPNQWTFDGPLTIFGSLDERTVFAATAGERIQWLPPKEGTLSLHDLAFESSLGLDGGSVTLTKLSVTGPGPVLRLADSMARLQSVSVSLTEEGQVDAHPGDAVVVTDSTLEWSDGDASALSATLAILRSSVTLSGLALSGEFSTGLRISDGSSVQAAELTVQDTRAAAFVWESELTLTNSAIANLGGIAVLVSDDASITIANSSFEDCPSGFIATGARANSVTLERNQFLRAMNDNCVTVSSGKFLMRDNRVDTCAGSGVLAIDLVDAVIEGNDVQNITLDQLFNVAANGISLLSTTGRVSGNIVKNTIGNGINISQSIVVVDSNTIGPIEGSGISYVEGPEARSTLSNNTITEATGAGIIVFDASVDVTGNLIKDTKLHRKNFADGIVFGSGANVSVTSNTVTGSVNSGILYLNGATGEIVDNTATGNGFFGITELCIGEVNAVVVGSNELTGNTNGERSECAL